MYAMSYLRRGKPVHEGYTLPRGLIRTLRLPSTWERFSATKRAKTCREQLLNTTRVISVTAVIWFFKRGQSDFWRKSYNSTNCRLYSYMPLGAYNRLKPAEESYQSQKKTCTFSDRSHACIGIGTRHCTASTTFTRLVLLAKG